MNENRRLVVFRRVALAAVLLCAVVVVLGAWVRLTAAGLGCPDWPTCYGHFTPAAALENQESINAAFPDRPLEYGKALREMVHRYAASTLGLLIVAMAIWAFANRHNPSQPLYVPIALVLVVILQGILGMLTVTWLLKPTIVTLHLLGGMTTLALLWWTYLASRPTTDRVRPTSENVIGLRRLAVIALIVLGIQIALGGWTSSHYAAVACPDFPTCQGSWWPNADFRDAFVLWRGLGIDYEGGVLNHPARVAIHLTHRVGAMLTTVVLAILAFLTLLRARSDILRISGFAIAAALILQLILGVTTVKAGFPLPLATAHNAGAAVLLLSVITLLHLLSPPAEKRP